MKKISKKIISSILIIMLLMPTFLVFADETIKEHEYKLEEYLKEYLNVEKLTDEELGNVKKLSVSDDAYSYIDSDYNMVNFTLDILPKLTNLEEINISFSGLKTFDFKLVSNLSKLNKIILETDSLNEIKNISEISKLENLKEISIKSNNKKFKELDLSWIEKTKSLENLKITSSSLTKIFANGTEVSNSNPISLILTCTNLKELEINSINSLNKIEMTDSYNDSTLINLKLSKLNNLETLKIEAKKLDKSEIANSINGNSIPKLKVLNFKLKNLENKEENLDLFDVFNISSFKELTSLNLNTDEDGDIISKINIKDKMPKLNDLTIDSQIKEINNIQNLTNLTSLYLNNVGINSIQVPENVIDLSMQYCDYLTELKLNEKLETLHLSSCWEIKELKLNNSLKNCDMSSLDELVNLELNNNLEKLTIEYCSEIKTIEIDENFKNLTELYLHIFNLEKLVLPKEISLKKLDILLDKDTVLTNYPTTLENLKISGYKENIIIPENLVNLQDLDIACYGEEDVKIDFPEEKNILKNLKDIYIYTSGANITNINTLNFPDNLENLHIYAETAKEITLRENLNKLYSVSLSDCENLEKLNLPEDYLKLENLQYLYIYESQIKELNCPINLRSLSINTSNNELDINISDQNNLYYLDITCPEIKEFAITDKLNKLNYFTIDAKKLEKLTLPQESNSLHGIEIIGDQIKNINIPENLVNLTNIKLTTSNLEKLNLPENTEKLSNMNGIYIYDCKLINELNYPDSLFILEINTRESEKINLKDNLSMLYSVELSGDNLKELNLPEDTSKLDNLEYMTLNCKKMNNINYPNNLKELNITSSEETNLNLPSNTNSLRKVKIKADQASINIENLKKYNMDKVNLICKNIQGNCIDELANLKGLKLFTQENFETEKISKLKKLQYLSLNQNYKPGEGDNGDIDSNSVLKYDQKPIYIGKTDSEVEYLYGFKFKNEDVYDNKSEFIKKFDYSKLIDEYYITDPKLEILDKDGKAIEDSTIIGTGNIVKIYNGEDLVVEYSIVYYGDVDGDGKWTAIDSLAIIKNNFTQNGYTIEEPFTFSSDIFEEAGRIISGEDTIPGAMDALAIVKQSFGTYSIDQYKNKVEEE